MVTYLQSFLTIAGLIFDFTGVIILTVVVDSSLDSLIDKLHGVGLNDMNAWKKEVKQWKERKRMFTIYGMGFLVLGVGLGVWVNWVTLWPTP